MTLGEIVTRFTINVFCIPFYRNSTESQQRIRIMGELDICSPKFSFSRAESEVKKQKGRMLCDVLMDQKVLPGVGNIIKNEALFDSGLHPAVKVGHRYFQNDFCIFKYCYGTNMEYLSLHYSNAVSRNKLQGSLLTSTSQRGQPWPLKIAVCVPSPHFTLPVFHNFLCFLFSPYHRSLSNIPNIYFSSLSPPARLWPLMRMVSVLVVAVGKRLEYSVWHMVGIKEIFVECMNEWSSQLSFCSWHIKFTLDTHSYIPIYSSLWR